MQNILFYLLPNRIRVVADMNGFLTEYRQVYQRKIKLYKGIRNTITLDVRNADQKKVDCRSYTPIINFFDTEHKLILTKVGTVNPSTPALVTVNVEALDIVSIENQTLMLTAYLNSESTPTLLYADAQFGLSVEVEIHDGITEKYRPPLEITKFQENFGDQKYYSELVPFGPDINDDIWSDSTNSTSVSYIPGEFRGVITVEATKSQSTAIGNDWTVVSTSTIVDDVPVDIDIVGNYTYLRFSFSNTAKVIDKILVRN